MSEERNTQNIILEGRKKISISGVSDVESFDETTITVITELGVLTIKGENIKIEKLNLDTGEVSAVGDFYLAEYISDEKEKSGGLFSRLFR